MDYSRSSGLRVPILLAALGGVFVAQAASGQMSPARRAELVLRLLPSQARPEATVLLRDGGDHHHGLQQHLRVRLLREAGFLEVRMHPALHLLDEALRLSLRECDRSQIGGSVRRVDLKFSHS